MRRVPEMRRRSEIIYTQVPQSTVKLSPAARRNIVGYREH